MPKLPVVSSQKVPYCTNMDTENLVELSPTEYKLRVATAMSVSILSTFVQVCPGVSLDRVISEARKSACRSVVAGGKTVAIRDSEMTARYASEVIADLKKGLAKCQCS